MNICLFLPFAAFCAEILERYSETYTVIIITSTKIYMLLQYKNSKNYKFSLKRNHRRCPNVDAHICFDENEVCVNCISREKNFYI